MTNNKGLVAIKTNDVRVITNYHRFLHIIDLDNYKKSISNIKKNILIISQNEKFKLIYETTYQKYKLLKTTLQLLLPITRTKRGIINILGTGIKLITGNMDSEDAIEINNRIQEIQINNKQLIESQNSQTKINEQMIKRFYNITNHI